MARQQRRTWSFGNILDFPRVSERKLSGSFLPVILKSPYLQNFSDFVIARFSARPLVSFFQFRRYRYEVPFHSEVPLLFYYYFFLIVFLGEIQHFIPVSISRKHCARSKALELRPSEHLCAS